MNLLDLTLPTPAANLACDEVLLDVCEQGAGDEVLRFWESGEYFVVVGYSNKISTEVNVAECARRGIPVLRRCSGGGTVVQGPGCLNYALVLRIPETGPPASLTDTNRFIMKRHREALETLISSCCHPEQSEGSQSLTAEILHRAQNDMVVRGVKVQGHTDLVLRQRKFSGNAQRRKRRYLLFHGSFLLHFDLALIEALLPLPSRQPTYRDRRSHVDFLTNVPVTSDALKVALQKTWGATETFSPVPSDEIRRLVESKYATTSWNLRC